MSSEGIVYRGRTWPAWKLEALTARERLEAIRCDRSHTQDERGELERVKGLARDPRNAKAVARYAALPLGVNMSPARLYAAALCTLRGWRYTLDELS